MKTIEQIQQNGQGHEWVIPTAPSGKTVTVSRAQFSPQADRLGILGQISQAGSIDELAQNLRGIFAKPKSVPSEKETGVFPLKTPADIQREGFVSFVFGKNERQPDGSLMHRGGIVSESERHILAQRLNGVRYEVKAKKGESVTIKHKIDPTIAPSNARTLLDRVFSVTNRSAGSKLAGVPLVALDRAGEGVQVTDRPDVSPSITTAFQYGEFAGNNSIAIFGKEVQIGQPYADRMEQSTKLIAQGVDVVSRHLDEFITSEGAKGRKKIPVEEATKFALAHMDEWLSADGAFDYDGPRSRTHLQMDFFLVPPREMKAKILDQTRHTSGFMNAETQQELVSETMQGNLKLAIFDISGGAGGTGVSEFIAKEMGEENSGLTQAYITSLFENYEERFGHEPERIAITPRRDDLTLIAFEYLPLLQELQAQGKTVDIILAEDLDAALDAFDNGEKFSVKTLDGRDADPQLIIKRFTFLGAGKEKTGDRGYIRTNLPAEVAIVPSPASRVAASDKRVNGRVIEFLRPQLEELGVEVIPTGTFDLVQEDLPKNEAVAKAVEGIISFAQTNVDQFPEIGSLGLVLKVDDKRPGRAGQGGELVSAYPVHAGILRANEDEKTREYTRIMLEEKLKRLMDQGAISILVQPNLLTGFDTGDIFMETKMLTYANKQKQ